MTTSTWNNINEQSSFPNPVKIIVSIIVLCALFLSVGIYFMNQETAQVISGAIVLDYYTDLTPAEIRIIEVVSGHAWTQHGNEPTKALDCLGRKGSTKSLKTTGFQSLKLNKSVPTNVWLCLDDDGTWYAIVTTEFIKDVSGNIVARLVTAYEVSKHLFPEIGDYLMYIGQKWGASYINKIIGAGSIYIQPK